ncbi:MAG: hypothetical protein NC097_07975 [Clostridium sp.]|nr:hypothetical protein [Clostridium sp.]MCM1474640.1 hypothetical protein [Muribaculaceae bacterium]
MEIIIERLCKQKEQELLTRFFGNLPQQAAIDRPEDIGMYTKDLPLKIEAEFREYLVELWRKVSDEPLVLEEQKLRWLMTEDDREALEDAYKNAKQRTLWERITKSNHEDVSYYKGLLHEYTRDLLMVMRHDFLEEITGKQINCKAFEG